MVTQLVPDAPKIPQTLPFQCTITDEAVQTYLTKIKQGASQVMAATYVGHTREGMEKHLKKHNHLRFAASRAEIDYTLTNGHDNLKRIANMKGDKAASAAVKAAQAISAVGDERHRKQRDANGPGFGGVQINIVSSIPGPSLLGYQAGGGTIDAGAMEAIEQGMSEEGSPMEALAVAVAVGEGGAVAVQVQGSGVTVEDII